MTRTKTSKTAPAIEQRFECYPVPEGQEDAAGEYISFHGWCASFCICGESDNGQSVDEHSPWCESSLRGPMSGVDSHAEYWSVYAELVRAYTHGRYLADERMWRWHTPTRDPLIRLILQGVLPSSDEGDTGDGGHYLYLTAAEALRFAEHLQFLARAADDLDHIGRPRARA